VKEEASFFGKKEAKNFWYFWDGAWRLLGSAFLRFQSFFASFCSQKEDFFGAFDLGF